MLRRAPRRRGDYAKLLHQRESIAYLPYFGDLAANDPVLVQVRDRDLIPAGRGGAERRVSEGTGVSAVHRPAHRHPVALGQSAAADVFWALADPTRRAVFERLAREGEASVSELTASSSVSQPAISQHLSALRRAGLVSDRHAGRYVYYRAVPSGLVPLVNWIEQYQVFWRDRLHRLRDLLEEMDSS